MINIYSTDVLVIGGGGAGVRAALESSQNNAETLLVLKGKIKKSGSSSSELSEISGYNAFLGLDPNDSREKFLEDICFAGENMCDKKLAKVLVDNADDSVRDLEKFGVNFEKKNGDYLFFKCCFSRHSRALTLFRQGRKIIEKLGEKVNQDPRIKIYENLFITDLLVKDGSCLGAIGIDKNQDIIIIRSKATILATGGFGGIFKNKIVPADVTGDGHAMALRAGCELVNIEFFQMGFATLYPRLVLFESWLWGMYPKMVNSEGTEFLSQYLPSELTKEDVCTLHSYHFPFSTRDNGKYLEIAAQSEVLKGKTSKHDGILVDFTFCNEKYRNERFRENAYLKLFYNKSYERLKKNKIDILKNMVEVNVFSHATNGGVRINTHAESSIKHLFAIGEVSGGVHGADRLGGNMLATAQVFGKIAGREAAKVAHKHLLNSDQSTEAIQIDKIKHLLNNISENKKDRLIKIDQSIKTIMSNSALIIREESRINDGLQKFYAIKKLLDHEPINSEHLLLALRIHNAVDFGIALLTVISTRKESRGAHFRKDYPKKKNKYEKNIILTQPKEFSDSTSPLINIRWENI